MKKIISILICALLVISVFAGCSAKGGAEKESKKLSIVCTIFPVYDWVNNVLGDKAEDAEVEY